MISCRFVFAYVHPHSPHEKMAIWGRHPWYNLSFRRKKIVETLSLKPFKGATQKIPISDE